MTNAIMFDPKSAAAEANPILVLCARTAHEDARAFCEFFKMTFGLVFETPWDELSSAERARGINDALRLLNGEHVRDIYADRARGSDFPEFDQAWADVQSAWIVYVRAITTMFGAVSSLANAKSDAIAKAKMEAGGEQ